MLDFLACFDIIICMKWYLNPPESFFIGSLEIRFYGVLVALGMLFGLLICCRLAKKRGFKSDDIWVLALFVLPLAILGARIYYCVFYDHSYTFLEFWRIWDGGIAVYGAIIGGAIGVALYCLIFKKNFLALADIVVVGVALGQAIGRIGCYFGHCCYGAEVLNDNLKFFPLSIIHDGKWHLATFFYESVWDLINMAILLVVLNKSKINGTNLGVYMLWYGIGRGWIEGLRGDSLFIGSSGIRVSQLISLIIAVAGLAMIIINLVKYLKERKTNGKEV